MIKDFYVFQSERDVHLELDSFFQARFSMPHDKVEKTESAYQSYILTTHHDDSVDRMKRTNQLILDRLHCFEQKIVSIENLELFLLF